MIDRQSELNSGLKVSIEPIPGIPMVQPGDNLGKILKDSLDRARISLRYKDVLVLAQKIVSKAERRVVNLNNYHPTQRALEMSQISGRDPRLVQLILNESQDVRWVEPGTKESPGIIVVKHKLGHVCSGSGIDMTNTGVTDSDAAILLPEDPDKSARKIANYIKRVSGVGIGVMVIDTLGDRNRMGSIGKAIGVANIPARVIEKRLNDLDGKPMLVSDVALADSLAGIAMIVMGHPDAGSPAVLVRGVDYPFTSSARIRDVLI